jgi:hypothetical protein
MTLKSKIMISIFFFLNYFLQRILRDLEFKKPQLDKLVSTADSLKSDHGRNQLQGKGKNN